MKIAVFMSDNRALDANKETCPYTSCAAYINAIYCVAHKYDFYYLRPYASSAAGAEEGVDICADPHNPGTLRHAAWAKLLSTLLILRSSKKGYDYIVYMDSDCVFKNFQKRIESVIAQFPDKDIIMSSNAPYHPHLPCSAFYICKNSAWTHSFISKWFNYKAPASDSAEWAHIIASASTTYAIPVFPIGKYWEQDTLWLMYQDPAIAEHIQLFPETTMFSEAPYQYIIHISHERTAMRKPYLLGYVEHLEARTKQPFATILSSIPVVGYDTSMVRA
jgi:hypothetical protein